jgi:hypothetical protein
MNKNLESGKLQNAYLSKRRLQFANQPKAKS